MINEAKKYVGIVFADVIDLMGYYNKHCYQLVHPNRRYRMKDGDDWCAMFTSVVAHKVGYREGEFPFEVSVYFQTLWAKERGLYTDSKQYVSVGDLVIYDWGVGNRHNHTGIVVEVVGGDLVVIEGNYKGTVGYRRVSRNSPNIRGFIQLDNVTRGDDVDELVKGVMRGDYGNGEERKRALGDKYDEVQKRVNIILNGR